MQVWWYISGVYKGKLFVHDLATSFTQELTDYRSDAAVVCMHVSPSGFIWMGYKGGSVRVWSAATRSPICAPLRAFQSDIRWAQGLRLRVRVCCLRATQAGRDLAGQLLHTSKRALTTSGCTMHLPREPSSLVAVMWSQPCWGRPGVKVLGGVAAACLPELEHAPVSFQPELVGTPRESAGYSAAFPLACRLLRMGSQLSLPTVIWTSSLLQSIQAHSTAFGYSGAFAWFAGCSAATLIAPACGPALTRGVSSSCC